MKFDDVISYLGRSYFEAREECEERPFFYAVKRTLGYIRAMKKK